MRLGREGIELESRSFRKLDPEAWLFESATHACHQLPPRPDDLTDKLKLLAAVLALGKVEGQYYSSSGCEGLPGPYMGPTARQICSHLLSGSKEGSTRPFFAPGLAPSIGDRSADLSLDV